MVLGPPRQCADIHGDGEGRAGGAGYSEGFAFHATDGYREGGCTTANTAVGDADRQNDIKRRTGRCYGFELVLPNLLKGNGKRQRIDCVAVQIYPCQGNRIIS